MKLRTLDQRLTGGVFAKISDRFKDRRAAARLQSALLFQARNYETQRDRPLDVEALFAPPTEGRDILIAEQRSNIHGRQFFLNALVKGDMHALEDREDRTYPIAIAFGFGSFVRYHELLARHAGGKVLFFEAGFLRGFLMDKSDSIFDRAMCFFIDDIGFHYDGNVPSRLELMLNDTSLVITSEHRARARRIIDTLVSNKITKYNDQSLEPVEIGRSGRKKVLIIEQARNDWSVLRGGGGASSFSDMLKRAIDDNPDHDIIIKIHPDTLDGKRGGIDRSYYGQEADAENIHIVREKLNPFVLLDVCDKVYVFSSMLGFEALLMGKETHIFGTPSYAGWGLTTDYQSFPRRRHTRDLEEMVYIIYVLYQKYKDEDGNWCEVEDMLDFILDLRRRYARGA